MLKPGTQLLSLGAAVLALLGGAESSGLLIHDAAAQVARRRSEDGETDTPLLVTPSDESASYLAHSSHSSHSSHASHRSHSSGGGGGGGGGYDPGVGGYDPAPTPAPAPPRPDPPLKPGTVSLVAYPGGRIFVNGQLVGHDATGTLTLKPGTHAVRVENRFVGVVDTTLDISEGQTGVVEINW